MMVGGFGGASEPDEKIHELVAAHKGKVEEHSNQSFPVFEAKAVRSQVVAGMNHKVKIHIGDNKFIHVKFYDRFGDVSVSAVELDKTADDEL